MKLFGKRTKEAAADLLVADQPRSRRELLAGAAGALGVLAAEAIVNATPARANDGDPMILGRTNTASSPTTLTTNDTDYALRVDSPMAGATGAVVGFNSNDFSTYGIIYDPALPAGVHGTSNGGYGVLGETDNGTGVVGKAGSTTAVYGQSAGRSGGSAYGGVVGDSNTNAGVVGLCSAPTRAAGEFNHVAGGRGGVFHGGKAQLKLSPSSASTHPKRGQRGDLFVDKSGRLWFCKGKTTWVQLA